MGGECEHKNKPVDRPGKVLYIQCLMSHSGDIFALATDMVVNTVCHGWPASYSF